MTKMWLSDRDYEFTEYNVSENAEYQKDLVRMGFRVTPVTVVDHTEMIVGFNPTKLEKALS